MSNNTNTDAPDSKSYDDLHRWEIEPHPDRDYDTLVTDSDEEARQHIADIAESHLWDTNEPGQEHTMTVRMNDVPTTDTRASLAPAGKGEADAISDLFALLSQDSKGEWCFNSFSNDWPILQGVLRRLVKLRAATPSSPVPQLDTQSLNAKLEDAGFDAQEMRVIQILISQSIKPAPDKGEVARRAAEKIYDAGYLDERWILEQDALAGGDPVTAIQRVKERIASIIEAELGGK